VKYYITGPDGSGKTTFLKEIEKLLTARGENPLHIWLRSPKIFSKPLMAYCRLVGLTKYEYIDGIKYGSHQFYRSKFVSWLFPFLQLVDFKIKWNAVKKKIAAKQTVLLDRFALDTLADLMIDTHRFELHKTWLGKQFLKYLDKQVKIIVLKVDGNLIKARKQDTKYDPNTDLKNEVYSILAKDLKLLEISNNRSIEQVKKDIIKGFGLE
jgi:thymidylate kinase